MNRNCFKYTFFIALALGVLVSCKVTKTYKHPDVSTNGLYRDQQSADTATLASMPWQSLFADTTLKSLIQEGLTNNLDLKTAVQKILEAKASLQQSKASFLPSLSGNASASRSKQSEAGLNFPPGIDINTLTTTYQAGLSTSWEADVWGKLSSTKRAALATFLQNDAAKRAVQTQLIADIANNYFSLLALDQQLEITKQTLKNRIKDVTTMKELKEGAVVNGAAVVQSEANRYAAEVSIPDIKRSIRETENALDILLSRPSGPVNRGTLANQKLSGDLQTGVPTQLLTNRPDVQQGEYAFRAAFENTNLARTYFYPSFTITASGGLSSLTLKDFFTKSIFYNAAVGLTQPIFNQGINKARLHTAQAQQQEALNSFQKTLLVAGQEVSNALYAHQTAVEKQDARSKQIIALQKSVDYTQELLRYSSATNYTDVLTSEQNLLAAQLSGVSDRLQELQAIVNLYRALGGGWR
ncbi:efflux transporter outer membrane subunit [Mucilaginibacter sp. SP1R1]|uniref:efflux transporter outer membrane subunit n=1 Tax=Mucilaginibacter sp. SP1R1 TaxID=2723091 RepID=UPI0016081504|nr:TolC family protein [Mucilaginibacter sp. SP1R1]MBB6149896.1 NodT family efflux transporter outer membrane factor (OMF) lipoprotein [Mucilaginibacter sp. SP1R1]